MGERLPWGHNWIDAAIGRRLEHARLVDAETEWGRLVLTFDDGSVLALGDCARHCCERRWLSCDDDLDSFTGRRLVSVEIRDVDNGQGDYPHEIAFVVVLFDDGNAITLCTHNEHNGYYGGFSLRAEPSLFGGGA